MKKLLEFIIKNILGEGKDFTVLEEENENFVNLSIKVSPEDIGMVIGKGGSTIKAIRNILRVKATLEKKGVSVSIL